MDPDLDAIVFQRPISKWSREYIEDYTGRMCNFINARADSNIVAPNMVPQAIGIALLSSRGISLESLETMRQYLSEKRYHRNAPTHARASISEHAPGLPDFVTEKTHLKLGITRKIGDRALVRHCRRSTQTSHALTFPELDFPLAHVLSVGDADRFNTTELNMYGAQFARSEMIRIIKLEPLEVAHPQPARFMEAA